MNGWACADLNSAIFQGYAPQTTKAVLQRDCPQQQLGSTSVLPFTGLDLGLGFTAAVLLLAIGVGLRRFGRRLS